MLVARSLEQCEEEVAVGRVERSQTLGDDLDGKRVGFRRYGRPGPSAQRLREIRRATMPIGDAFGQRLQADPLELLGDGVAALSRRLRFVRLDLLQNFPGCFTGKWPRAGQHFVQHDSQAKDVRAAIDQMALMPSLLGTHVGRRACRRSLFSEVLIPHGQAEVRHIGLAMAIDQDVGRLDVAMDQSAIVRLLKCIGHACQQFRRLRERQWMLLQVGSQVHAVDILGNYVA